MLLHAADYRSRLTSPSSAAARIPSGAKIAMGLGIAQPPALLAALAARATAGEVDGLRLYYLLSTSIAGNTVLTHALRDRIRPMSLFHSAVERALDTGAAAAGCAQIDFLPTAFSQTPRLLCEQVDVDVLLTTVAPMDEDGHFSLGTNTDYAHAVSKTARIVILEVNPSMPRLRGNCTIPLSRVTAIVENAAPLLALPRPPIRPKDAAIASIIAGLAEDGMCLQMGIGALPDAVCAALASHRNLGIHTELMTPGLTELMRQGAVDNSRKSLHPGKSIFTFALGDRTLYDYLGENPNFEAHPVEYVNDPCIIAKNPRMLSINATLQIDLQGACNSEYLGGRQFSAAGGQLDFVRGAWASPGGKSIIACHATCANGTISRIVPTLDGPVTVPRNDTHIVVTEYGWTDLKGKTLGERAKALIGLADPKFREDLEKSQAVLF